MFKNSLKKIGAVVCALALASQLVVLPAGAAYINEDQSIYKGDLKESADVKIETVDGVAQTGTIGLYNTVGDYTVSVDTVFNGLFPPGSATKNVSDSTYFYFGTSKPVGAHLMISASTEKGFTLQWKSDRQEAVSPVLEYGKKYTIIFDLKEVGTGNGASMTVTIKDADGKQLWKNEGGSLRNYSGDNKTATIPSAEVKVCTTAGTESSVELSNIKFYKSVGDEIAASLDGKVLDPEKTTEIELSTLNDVKLPIMKVLRSGGNAVTAYKLLGKLEMKDGSATPKEFEVTDDSLNASVLLPGSDVDGEFKEYDTNLTFYVDGYPEAKVTFPILFKKGKLKDQDIVDNYIPAVTDKDGKEFADNAEVSVKDELTLDKGNAKVDIKWSSSNDEVIDPDTGKVMPLAEDTEVTLTAKVYSATDGVKTYFGELTEEQQKEVDEGTAVKGTIITKTVVVKGVKAIVDAAIAAMTYTSNDDNEAIDFNEAVNEDIKLTTSYADDSNVKFDWTTNKKSNVTITKSGVAELVQDSTKPVDVTIKCAISYVKDSVVLYETEEEKEFTIDMTQDGTDDKYIVRCDYAAASDNFGDLPEEDDKVTSSKLDLPTKGIFGSTIKWSSSVPSTISSSGKVTRSANAKKVTLTAIISKGSAPSETYTIKNLVVPSTKGSTTSSGGGSGSSSAWNSGTSSTGNRATSTSYQGVLTPTTSVEKGDITTAQVAAFTDLATAAWAKEAITALYNKGIINGKAESTFAPNDEITRAEFAKIVVKAFGLEDTSANTSDLKDVHAGDWFYTAVCSAYNKGIIKGYEDGTFGVNDKITRQDMAVILHRAAKVAGKTIAEVKPAVSFEDAGDIAVYAVEAVSTLQKGGVINGMTATTFAPKATATRAQAAQMIYGIVK